MLAMLFKSHKAASLRVLPNIEASNGELPARDLNRHVQLSVYLTQSHLRLPSTLSHIVQQEHYQKPTPCLLSLVQRCRRRIRK